MDAGAKQADIPRDESRDDERYVWIRNNVAFLRTLLLRWDDTLTPAHFDNMINNAMRDFPLPLDELP